MLYVSRVTHQFTSSSDQVTNWHLPDYYCLFIEPNDPYLVVKVIDTTDSHLLWNLAMVWGRDDHSEGFL